MDCQKDLDGWKLVILGYYTISVCTLIWSWASFSNLPGKYIFPHAHVLAHIDVKWINKTIYFLSQFSPTSTDGSLDWGLPSAEASSSKVYLYSQLPKLIAAFLHPLFLTGRSYFIQTSTSFTAGLVLRRLVRVGVFWLAPFLDPGELPHPLWRLTTTGDVIVSQKSASTFFLCTVQIHTPAQGGRLLLYN